MASEFYRKIYKIICQIPKGKVATYGQIAALAGNPRAARAVGWALRAVNEELPWHRVINSNGKSSFPELAKRRMQQALLEQEGIRFDLQGTVDLKKFQWRK